MAKSTRDDKLLFDVFFSLYNKPNERLLIQVTKKQDFKQFLSKINESLELRYDNFKGLKGLRVKELRTSNANATRQMESSHILDTQMKMS